MEQSLINITPLNPNLSECHIKVLYHGLNRNGSYISKSVAEKMANKLPGTPIVGMYIEEKQDFDDHGERVVIKGGKAVFKKMTKPFGFIKQDTKVWWQQFNENGQEKDYMMCEGYLWTNTYPEVKRVIEKGNWQSMEFNPKTLKGEWAQMNHENGSAKKMFMVEDGDFKALCILGEDVEPCFETASIGAPGSLFTLEDEFKSDFNQIKYNIQKSLEKGGSEVPEVNHTEGTVETPVVVSPEVETPEVTEEEVQEEQEVVVVEETVVEEEVNEEEIQQEEETEEQAAEPEQGEEQEEEVVEESEVQSTPEEQPEVVEDKNTKEDLEELTKKLVKALEELDLVKEQFALANEELVSLRSLKAKVDTEAKNNMFAKFYMLDEEDVKSVREHQDELSVEEIESKLAVIAFHKKVNFSMLEEDKEEEVITSFTAETENTTPAWLRRVEDIKKNRK